MLIVGTDVLTRSPVHIYGFYKSKGTTNKNGVTFCPARIYNVASKDICVARIDPNGKIWLYAETLWASSELCAAKCKYMAEQTETEEVK